MKQVLGAAVIVLACLAGFLAYERWGASGSSTAMPEMIPKLALQVSDNSPEKMNAALNVAANVSRHYADKGEEAEVVVVAFNAGLHMLRQDTSPVKERLTSFKASMPNVKFAACGNTIEGMQKKEGREIPVVAEAKVVPAGVVTLMELSQQGYVIVRP